MQTLRTETPKARKRHQCDYCGGMIEKGEVYDSQTNVYDYLYTWKSHKECSEIANKLKMHDECDEGVTGDDFSEIINEVYGELTEWKKSSPEFLERLKFVINYYKNETNH